MSLVVRLAPFFLLVCPFVVNVIFGVNFRVAQFVTWNGTDTGAVLLDVP